MRALSVRLSVRASASTGRAVTDYIADGMMAIELNSSGAERRWRSIPDGAVALADRMW